MSPSAATAPLRRHVERTREETRGSRNGCRKWRFPKLGLRLFDAFQLRHIPRNRVRGERRSP